MAYRRVQSQKGAFKYCSFKNAALQRHSVDNSSLVAAAPSGLFLGIGGAFVAAAANLGVAQVLIRLPCLLGVVIPTFLKLVPHLHDFVMPPLSTSLTLFLFSLFIKLLIRL